MHTLLVIIILLDQVFPSNIFETFSLFSQQLLDNHVVRNETSRFHSWDQFIIVRLNFLLQKVQDRLPLRRPLLDPPEVLTRHL